MEVTPSKRYPSNLYSSIHQRELASRNRRVSQLPVACTVSHDAMDFVMMSFLGSLSFHPYTHAFPRQGQAETLECIFCKELHSLQSL